MSTYKVNVLDGEIISIRCGGPCGRVRDPQDFARDKNNKTTGRQRRCRECFAAWQRTRPKCVPKDKAVKINTAVPPEVAIRLRELAPLRGMTSGEFVRYILTLYTENVLDMEYEGTANSGN